MKVTRRKKLNSIKYPSNKLVEKKLNFFADYFNFAIDAIYNTDLIEKENYISIMDKIIFQIETNQKYCVNYINSYIQNPLIQKKNKYFKEFKNYNSVSALLEKYKKIDKKSKVEYITSNINILKRFRTEAKKTMFKNSLKFLVSFLESDKKINVLQDDLLHYTNMIVTEFFYKDFRKINAEDIFCKISTNNHKEYPFSKNFINKNKNNLEIAKRKYIENRNLCTQLLDIYNIHKDKPKTAYFIFRIYNTKSRKDNFTYRYNKVTFYSSNHPKLNKINSSIKDNYILELIYGKNNFIFAVVKVKYQDFLSANQIAVSQIKKEMIFINSFNNNDIYLDELSYLYTTDFESFAYNLSFNSQVNFIENYKTYDNKNSFKTLKKINAKLKSKILDNEFLYFQAIKTNSPEDFWQYLEAIKPTTEKEVSDIFSNILLLSVENDFDKYLELYISNQIIFADATDKIITKNKQKIKFDYKHPDCEYYKSKIDYPILNTLYKKLDNYNKPENIDRYYWLYKRTLTECRAQRNSIIHKNIANEKEMLKLEFDCKRLIERIKKSIIDEMLLTQKNNEIIKYDMLIMRMLDKAKKIKKAGNTIYSA